MKEKIEMVARVCFKLMIVVFFFYLVAGELFLPSSHKSNDKVCKEYVVDWEQVFSDGSRKKVDMPSTLESEDGRTITIESVIPDYVENNLYIMLWSQRQDVKMYVDGKLREEYSTRDVQPFSGPSADCYVFMRTFDDDEGKLLRIELESQDSYVGLFKPMFYGDKFSIWGRAAREGGGEFVLAVLLFFLSFVSGCVSTIFRMIYKKKIDLEYLSWGIVVAGIWLIANSVFKQIVFPNIAVIADMGFITVMLLPMPFLLYANDVQGGRYSYAYSVLEAVTVVDFVVCLVLHVTKTVDLTRLFSYMALVAGVSIVLIFVTCIIDTVKGYIREYIPAAIGILVFCISAVAQIYIYLNVYRKRPVAGQNSVLLVIIGLTVLLIVTIFSSARNVVRLAGERQQAIIAKNLKDQFLANMSHEIRTPLNAVLGMDEMIIRETKEPKIREYAEDIQRAGRGLLSIINDILDFSKIEAGKMEIVPVKYDVSSLLNDAYNMVDLRARNKGLALICKNNHEIPRRLFGDEVRVRQIIINILTNAVKYTKQGSVTLEANYEKISDEEIMLKIFVKDTGIGIKKENQEKLFESFQRLDVKKNRTIEGTGLGLSITKRLVDLMDGKIWVESEYGHGSTFFLELPQKIVDCTPMGAFSDKQKTAVSENEVYHIDFIAPKARILVVDDMEMNLRLMKALLRATQMKVVTCKSGADCLKKVVKEKYDIVFLDHMMPEMDGMETLSHMRELEGNKNVDTPIIMLTANAIVGAKEEYLKSGFVDYLSKPVDMKKLAEMVKQYLPDELLQEVLMADVSEDVAEDRVAADGNSVSNQTAPEKTDSEKKAYDEKMRQLFLKKNNCEQLSEAYEKADWETYQKQLHILCKRAEAIGEWKLSRMAGQLEEIVREHVFEQISGMHEECVAEYRRVISS